MPDSFPWLSLDDDEEIVWAGRPRLQVLLYVAVPALVLPAVVVLLWSSLGGALAGLLAWGAVVGLGYVYVTNVEYVVSTKYAYAKQGVLGRSVTQIGLHNIQDTTTRQGVLGTQFGYGTLAFSTAGGEGVTLGFHVIDDPGDVKHTVDRQISSVGADAGGGPADGQSAVDELLAEATAMRDAAQRIDAALERRGDRR